MMIEVQYRVIYRSGGFSNWFEWRQLHNKEIAIAYILKDFYKGNSEAIVDNFFNVNSPIDPIYELIDPFNLRDFQFRFVEIPVPDSPWKIGLNDD